MGRQFLGVGLIALALGACATSGSRPIAAVDDKELRQLMTPLASDGFEGRMAGTEGERLTVNYVVASLKSAGIAGGLEDGRFIQGFQVRSPKLPAAPPSAPDGQAGFIATANSSKPFTAQNVIARIPGRKPDGKAVILMAHHDHIGLCRPADPIDKICNGAVDNASGTAILLALAPQIKAMRLDRDVWILFTGAEEWGLLGAHAFVKAPPLPLSSIVAGFNLDTTALGPKGLPVAFLGVKNSPLRALVREIAVQEGRAFDDDHEADGLLHYQDGWAFAEKGIPVVMAMGGLSDMARFGAFASTRYHGHKDELAKDLDLTGAADDANLHLALVRRVATAGWSASPR